MMPNNFFSKYFETLNSKLLGISCDDLVGVADLIRDTSNAGGNIIIAGNGGSAAMASHVSVDLVKAAGIRSINFNEADLITCFANDFGYENWISKALEYYASPIDLVILISSSGQSKNIINAANYTKTLGINLVTLSAFSSNNPLRSLGKYNLWVNTDSYNIAEMTHHTWLLSIVDYLISEM
jgi:D-sedoheptulose 7-phosphate isomerase